MKHALLKKCKELLLSFPSFAWLILFFAVPACIVYAFAFRISDSDGNILPIWGLESIRSLLTEQALIVTWRTIYLSTITAILCTVIALPIAYYIATLPKRHQPKCLLLVVIPLWSSFLVRIFAWKTLLHPEGIIKRSLDTLGIMSPHSSLLYNSATVLLVMCISYLPFAILPIYSAAAKFNFHLFEAAMDLGATQRQAFFRVFVPAMRPAMLTASLIVLIPAAGAYVIPEVVGGSNTQMIGNLISQKVFIDRNLSDASALSLLLSGVILIPAICISSLKEASNKKTSKVPKKC